MGHNPTSAVVLSDGAASTTPASRPADAKPRFNLAPIILPAQFDPEDIDADALPDDDQVLSPVVPLAGLKSSGIDDFDSIILEQWVDQEPIASAFDDTFNELGDDTTDSLGPRSKSLKRPRKKRRYLAGAPHLASVPGSVPSSSAVCVISERKPLKTQKSRRATTGMGSLKKFKEPSKFKSHTMEQVKADLAKAEHKLSMLKHKHRKGLECPKCTAARDVQILNRVVLNRKYLAKLAAGAATVDTSKQEDPPTTTTATTATRGTCSGRRAARKQWQPAASSSSSSSPPHQSQSLPNSTPPSSAAPDSRQLRMKHHVQPWNSVSVAKTETGQQPATFTSWTVLNHLQQQGPTESNRSITPQLVVPERDLFHGLAVKGEDPVDDARPNGDMLSGVVYPLPVDDVDATGQRKPHVKTTPVATFTNTTFNDLKEVGIM